MATNKKRKSIEIDSAESEDVVCSGEDQENKVEVEKIKRKQYNKEYRETHKEYDKRYKQTHRTEVNARARERAKHMTEEQKQRRREMRNKNRKRNKDTINAKARQVYNDNPEPKKQKQRQYTKSHPEVIREQAKRHKLKVENDEQLKKHEYEWRKKYNLEKREKINARAKKNYVKNHDHKRLVHAEWRAKNGHQEKINEKSRQTYAQRIATEPEFKEKQKKKFARYKKTAHYQEWRKEWLSDRRITVENRWNSIQGGANQRDITFMIKKEFACDLFIKPCHYCGLNPDSEINGIDRVDNDDAYVEGNVVPCCKWCNWMKLDLDVYDFIRMCLNISINLGQFHKLTPDYHHFIGELQNSGTFENYRYSAAAKNRPFELDKDFFNLQVQEPCFYCGIHIEDHTLGLDRVDSNLGYLEENVVTCCPRCNRMKSNRNVYDFIQNCIAVATHSGYHLIPDVKSE